MATTTTGRAGKAAMARRRTDPPWPADLRAKTRNRNGKAPPRGAFCVPDGKLKRNPRLRQAAFRRDRQIGSI